MTKKKLRLRVSVSDPPQGTTAEQPIAKCALSCLAIGFKWFLFLFQDLGAVLGFALAVYLFIVSALLVFADAFMPIKGEVDYLCIVL